MAETTFHINAEDAGKRLDLLVSELSGLTRSQVQRLIEKEMLSVNGNPSRANYKAHTDDLIHVSIVEENEELLPENLPVEVLYCDDFLMVVNKPAGMVVYPAAGHSSGTLMNAIAFHAKKLATIGGPLRPGVVHRLDKETSGVMVVALDDKAYYDLVEQFRKRTMSRRYKTLIFGTLKEDSGEISLRIGRSESDRKKMSTHSKRGKEAVTTWRVVERYRSGSLIEAKLGTGRTHQIRVHFASIGHPVLGDKTYGSKISLEIGRKRIVFPRQMLHAELLGFTHPVTKEWLEFRTPVPQDMEEKISELRNGISLS
ncbi:MAG: RluA family pseudouridine synthase [Nitrospirae bacterium]|nr:RluA family pseudouridine synthase [Nitrospirota bacterium]